MSSPDVSYAEAAARALVHPAQRLDEIGRLARCRVLELIGRGAMGAVFRAEDLHLGRHVALKVMRSNVTADDKICARFLREARSVAVLKTTTS